MSKAFTLPQLRRISSTSAITVPAGEHWIVKSIAWTPNPAVFYTGALTGTINGNTIRYFDKVNQFYTTCYAQGWPKSTLLYPGDTINWVIPSTTTTIDLYYWIVEQDFGQRIADSIPGLRYYYHLGIQDGFHTLTIPAGQTWIVKAATFHWSGNNGSGGNRQWDLDMIIDGNTMRKVISIRVNQSSTPGFIHGGTFISQSSVILRAGDQITMRGAALTFPERVYAEFYYWILEQDF
ncbi:MAG: hypothetical protein GWN64_07990 [Candidatus Thorarchaeota archaeon]|nr:hypothetical protein [Candidatus Thorarchaeota archaeon]